MKPKDFVMWVYPQAKQMSDISPVFVTAQAALETGWGNSAIGNNLFGITKGKSWNGPVKLVTTTEYFSRPDVKFNKPEEVLEVSKVAEKTYKYKVRRFFRDYSSVGECLNDHLSILKKSGYSDAWPYRNSPREYVRKIVDTVGLRYATSPTYVATMDKMFAMVEKIVKEKNL